jgi:hypothetical protein
MPVTDSGFESVTTLNFLCATWRAYAVVVFYLGVLGGWSSPLANKLSGTITASFQITGDASGF